MNQRAWSVQPGEQAGRAARASPGGAGLAGVVPPRRLPGSQFGAQFSTVHTHARLFQLLVTWIAANVCASLDPAKGNWKSCWVLQPSRVQIPHPPPR